MGRAGQRSPFKRILTGIVAFSLISGTCMSAFATQVEVDAAREQVDVLQQERANVEQTIKNLEGLKSDTVAYIGQLDAALAEISEELAERNAQVEEIEEEIRLTDENLEEAREREASQYEAMKLRIQYMYESGNSSVLDLLFNATDLSQLLNRAEYIQQISEYDKRKMDEYVETKDQIAGYEEALNLYHGELVEAQAAAQAQQQSVETLLAEKNSELKNVEGQIGSAQGALTEYDAAIAQADNEIKQMEAEIRRREEEEARRAAKEAAASGSEAPKRAVKSLGNISFIWPCPSSSTISSTFGSRDAPMEGASSNHQGVDISASTGSTIVAAASGEVVIATYSASAGNYVMINHGGGVYTVYMHCSSLSVSEGDEVSQGQKIASVGSTGYSTGPHLHFGVRSDGEYVNPLNYVSP